MIDLIKVKALFKNNNAIDYEDLGINNPIDQEFELDTIYINPDYIGTIAPAYYTNKTSIEMGTGKSWIIDIPIEQFVALIKNK